MNPNKNYLWVIFVLLVASVCTFCWFRQGGLPGGLDGKWQAVFLIDGQVYFGKLGNESKNFATLKEVYYLKVSSGLQQGGVNEATGNLNLIKLGGEAHGPESEMFITKDKILFIENLKTTSTVVQAILNNQK